MNWDIIKGNWKQFKGEVRENWGKLTEDDLDVVEGQREKLIGKLQERYGIAVAAEELRTIAPATIAAILQQLAAKHGIPRRPDDDRALAAALAARLLDEMDGMGLDLSDLKPEMLSAHLVENLHSPVVMDEVLHRFTVRALVDYLAAQLGKASRLANGA